MRDTILTFEERFGVRDHALVASANPSNRMDTTPPSGRVRAGTRAVARVDHGRWIADCPFGCGGAELVSFDRPLFFCCECRNATVGHDFVAVLVPAEGKRGDIEAALVARPSSTNRHWHPLETVAQLRAENAAHGIRG